MVQSYHPFGDNGSAFAGFTRWIDEWNASGKAPHIELATPRMWWAAVKEYLAKLPTHRGDWTDYWNFGCASSAREQTINRQSRARLRTADAIAAAVQALPPAGRPVVERSLELYRTEAWDNLIFWDEHTWGADNAIRQPDGEDTASQWNAKANFAYRARSLSLMLQRDALAALARRVDGAAMTCCWSIPCPGPAPSPRMPRRQCSSPGARQTTTPRAASFRIKRRRLPACRCRRHRGWRT